MNGLKAEDQLAQITELSPNNDLNATCTTCDNIATGDTKGVTEKFQCLIKQLPNGTPAVVENQRRAFLKLLLERRAHLLNDNQKTAILRLYSEYQDDRPTCGQVWQPPSPDHDEIAGTIQLCSRVANSHDSTPVQSLSAKALAPVCIDAVRKARALPDSDSRKALYTAEIAKASVGVLVSACVKLDPYAPRRSQIQERLKLISDWYAVAKDGAFNGIKGNSDLWLAVRSVTGALWSSMYSQELDRLTTAVSGKDAAAINAHLGNATAIDREMLEAIFGIGSDGVPISTTPFLELFTGALYRLDRRLQEYSTYHDLACRFLGCASPPRMTELVILQRLVAALPNSKQLAIELNAARVLQERGAVKFSDEWGKWRTTFELILAKHAALENALLDATGEVSPKQYDPKIAIQASADAPEPLRSFVELVQGAKRRVDRYALTGQLLITAGQDEIILGLRRENQETIVNTVRQALDRLSRAKGEYQSARTILLNGLLTEASSAQTYQASVDRATQLVNDMSAITDDIRGLSLTAEQDTARFSDFSASYVQAMRAASSEAPPLKVDMQIAPHEIRASDARYSGGTKNSIASSVRQPGSPEPWKVLHGEVGDVLELSVKGAWSPTCAMKDLKMFGKLDLEKAAKNAPDTTSQGFFAQFTGSEFEAGTKRNTWNASTNASVTTCLHGEAGSGINFIFKEELTVTADACLSVAGGYTKEKEDSQGDESRDSATFTSGIRLPNTPFPSYPVGSLLAILAKSAAPGQTPEILDVQVVLPEHFTIVFSKAADLYFVVNDRSCNSSRGQLTVEGVHMKPTLEKMRQLGEAMASVRQSIHGEANSLVTQGRLLPTQTAQLRTMAWQALYNACNCEADSYPSAVRGFYSLWIDTEVARVERQVEILALQRRLKQIVLELEATARQVQAEQNQNEIGSRVATLALSSLDFDFLRGKALALAKVVHSEFAPFVFLRYPEAITGPEGILNTPEDKAYLVKLTELDWSKPADDAINTIEKAIEPVLDHMKNAADKAPTPSVTTLVIGFRNPYSPAPTAGSLPSPWNWIDDARARSIWDSIYAGKPVFIELRPEDIYGRDALSFDCNKIAPVVATMALYVERPGDTSNDSLNSGKWSGKSRAETRMLFPVVDGVRTTNFTNADWLRKDVRFLYGPEIKALDVFHRIAQSERTTAGISPYDECLAGISPFTRIIIDPIIVKGDDGKEMNLANPIKDINGKLDATALMLILELETRIDSREVKGVLTCTPKN